MTMTYRLHYAPDNASLVIRLALEELAQPYETVLVDRRANAQRSVEYKALNPSGKIPTLETPDGPISETGAVLLWLADRHGHLGPSPKDADRGPFLKWLFFMSNTLHPALRMMFYTPTYVGRDADAQAALKAGARRHVQDGFDQLNTVLAGKPAWFGAKDPSILDLYAACLWRWVQIYPPGQTDWITPATWPHLQDLASSMETRPSVARARAAEGLGAAPFTKPAPPTPPEGRPY